MGLVDRVLAEHRRRSWPVGDGALLGFDGVYGHDQSEFSPDEYGDYLATSNDIYSIVSLRARMLSALRLGFYRGDTSDKVEVPDSPAAQLYRYVNPFWTAKRLARMDELCMGTWGETYWAVEKDRGQPKEIWWLKPSRVQPVPDETGYISQFVYQSVTGGAITFEADEIVWFRYPNPIDEFSPLSPLAAARLAADTSSAMMKSNQQLFSQGMQAAGIIVPATDKVTFTNEQADDLELHLKKKLTGTKNAHKWAVLRYEAQFKQLSMSPKDAEYAAGMGLTFAQACRAYGIHPTLLGQSDGATLANVREFQRGAWETALGPDADFKAEDVREQYLPMFRGGADHVEYDYSKVPALQESESEVWTREAQALDRGAITINEWRKRRGLPPVPWGDRPYMPVNKAPLAPDGSLDLPDTSETNPPDDETNPANQPESPRILDHLAARRLLAELHLNGARL
ncbi:phage portal protein [Lysinibacillus fusiformis]|uniref:phage portal protein n=1 Tax=Lysinibacillus fusiformis TaxID=28031 RepID=UPI003D07A181